MDTTEYSIELNKRQINKLVKLLQSQENEDGVSTVNKSDIILSGKLLSAITTNS